MVVKQNQTNLHLDTKKYSKGDIDFSTPYLVL
jgi:hypothetical protein